MTRSTPPTRSPDDAIIESRTQDEASRTGLSRDGLGVTKSLKSATDTDRLSCSLSLRLRTPSRKLQTAARSEDETGSDPRVPGVGSAVT
jgi:hypothetical protein